MVEVLAPACDVGTDGLDVAVGVRTDPDVLPRRRDDQIPDAGQGGLVGERLAVLIVIGEAAPASHPVQAGPAHYAAAQPHCNLPLESRSGWVSNIDVIASSARG